MVTIKQKARPFGDIEIDNIWSHNQGKMENDLVELKFPPTQPLSRPFLHQLHF